MQIHHLRELLNRQFITAEQFDHIEPIITRKRFSVYYELRIILYLAIMLFSAGVGILIYKNIGDLGHLIAILTLFVLTGVCFAYSFRHAQPYSNGRIIPPTPFYDYIVLLSCLLFISSLGYLQFQYEILNNAMGITTLVTAAFFFYAAYRFDHLGVLSLAITALASFWSITISPQKWYSGDFFDNANLHNTAMIFGASLAAIALLLDRREIKTHFTFTYLNFCSLIYLSGSLAGIFINYNSYGLYLIALYVGCALIAYYAHLNRSFLFLLYAFLFSYIGTTYFLADFVLRDPFIWFFYLIASCGGLVAFVIRYKSYFKRAS